MDTLWRILLLVAVIAGWPCWRAWFYPGAPFQAAVSGQRKALHRNRMARWSASFQTLTQQPVAHAEPVPAPSTTGRSRN